MNKYKQPKLNDFQETVWDFYHRFGRSFVWRNAKDPYKITISEVMLQQTQTFRVIEKYDQFIDTFSSFEILAGASLHDVLSVWQGLGYNRRGKFLHQLAQQVVEEYKGVLPDDPVLLLKLPGIGPATAASICAFAFNKPTVFIETNIRAVFIHFFFKDKQTVHDNDIFPLIEQTIDTENPREWYYALMDYGVMLKRTTLNPSRKSKHYARQSKFEGSTRQIRGQIIKQLTDEKRVVLQALKDRLPFEINRIEEVIQDLKQEQMITVKNDEIFIL